MRQIGLAIGVILLAGACTAGPPAGSEAELIDVVDGDTLRMRIGDSVKDVRLVGLNTPERDECFAARATAELARLVVGASLRFEAAGPEATDRFGRLLGYVYANDLLTNHEMVRIGSGVAVAGDHPRSDEFTASADAAWEARSGMWGERACGERATDAIAIDAIEPDPPGDDNDRPNDELIVLRNTGVKPADIGRWIIRDESSSHRLTVPDGTVFAPGALLTIHSGCGSDTTTDIYWCTGPVWSNRGDTVIVQTPDGNVVDRVSYRNR